VLNRGAVVWKDKQVLAQKGQGKYIERPAFPAIHVANSTWKELTAPRPVSRIDVTP
jgi:dihydropyrimidinase